MPNKIESRRAAAAALAAKRELVDFTTAIYRTLARIAQGFHAPIYENKQPDCGNCRSITKRAFELIIINDMPGQLCNRLWSYAPYIALSQRERVRVVIPFFVDYASLFPNINCLRRVHFVREGGSLYMRIMQRLLRTLRNAPNWLPRLFRMRIDTSCWGQENWDYETLVSPCSMVFLAAWNHDRPIADLRPFRPELATIFRPPAEVCQNADGAIQQLRNQAEYVVGVHMRAGDYRTFLNGKYFFDCARYATAMHEVATQLSGTVAFFVCSNEPVSEQCFPGLVIGRSPNGDPLEDLYGLSLCDFIIAAPSTFSLWASFCGEVPIGFLLDEESPLDLSTFSSAISLSELENKIPYSLKDEAEAIHGPWITAQ